MPRENGSTRCALLASPQAEGFPEFRIIHKSSAFMELTDKQLNEFQRLYKKRFDKELPEEQAREKAGSMIRLVREVYSFNN